MDGYRELLYPESFSEEKSTLFFLWNSERDVEKMRMSVNMWNGITFYFISKDYIEGCAFGGGVENLQLGEFYLNNLEILKKFFMHFKSAAKDIIDITDKSKVMEIAFHDKNLNPYKADPGKVIEFNKKILSKKYSITTGQKEFTISTREIECLLYKSQGLTAKQIARECHISPRTVEN
ncbi:MAG TPA: helix-turn-helix transcriptional regulator, partial [Alphaproteobacteria bacterium]|nr:helix-turn-helix transcriptional regulator [Alphaproteobacteria bacterium]